MDKWNIDGVSVDIGNNVTIQNNLSVGGAITGNLYGYGDSAIIVQSSLTDEGRFEKLEEAYAAAKLLTPGGNALSASNRASVIIPPGTYDAGTDTLVLDQNYVDLVALVPETPSRPIAGVDYTVTEEAKIKASAYKPTGTVIVGTGLNVVTQSVDDIRMVGFSIANISDESSITEKCAFNVTDESGGENSIYEKMFFYVLNHYEQSDLINGPANPMFVKDVSGTWIDCVAAMDQAWRLDYTGDNDTTFSAKMYNCFAGWRSFGGDFFRSSSYTHKFSGCYLYRCLGTSQSFGGCGTWGIPSDSTAEFVECETYSQGFSIGTTAGGRYIRCKGGDDCFGGTTSTILGENVGEFSGYAEDCVGGFGSFGRSDSTAYAAGNIGKCSGTLVGCTLGERDNFVGSVSMHCEGAIIDNCYIPGGSGDGTGFPTIILNDSNTVIRNSILENFSGDTAGASIGATSAQNVIAVNNVLYNGTVFATGLNASVTNLAATDGNAVVD